MTAKEKRQLLKVCELLETGKERFSCFAIFEVCGKLTEYEYGEFYGLNTSLFWGLDGCEDQRKRASYLSKEDRIMLILLFREVNGLEGLNAE